MIYSKKQLEEIHNKGFNLHEVIIMNLLNINSPSDNVEDEIAIYLSDEILEHLDKESIIKRIKKKKKSDSDFSVMRLSSKGKKLFKEFNKEPIGNTDDNLIKNWLVNYYRERGKEVGNEKRILQYLVKFRLETGIERNCLAYLFTHFLNSDYVEENSNVLEFALFYPKKFTTDGGKTIAYEAKWDVEDSWIYRHYKKHETFFKEKFQEIKQ